MPQDVQQRPGANPGYKKRVQEEDTHQLTTNLHESTNLDTHESLKTRGQILDGKFWTGANSGQGKFWTRTNLNPQI